MVDIGTAKNIQELDERIKNLNVCNYERTAENTFICHANSIIINDIGIYNILEELKTKGYKIIYKKDEGKLELVSKINYISINNEDKTIDVDSDD